MFAGIATFPGMKDAYDQLDQIFRVSNLPFYDWPDIYSELPPLVWNQSMEILL